MLVSIQRFVFPIALLCMLSPVHAQLPAIPQIPAFLPTVDQVTATQPMPLDGTWLINTIRKKIRIESGRAYAVDDWLHLFTLKIEPGMVVIKDISPTGPGQYTGQDLPLMGRWTVKVLADRSLSVSVAGAFGPVNYKLIPVQLDNEQWYRQEMAAAGLSAPQQTYQPAQPSAYQPAPPGQAAQPVQPASTPVYQAPAPQTDTKNCAQTEYDPATDTVRCYNEGAE
jgi:hypothetical protein